MGRRRRILTWMVGGLLILFSLLYLLPYVWMTSMSFKPDSEIYSRTIFPKDPTLEQYSRLFYGYKFKDLTLKIQFPTYYKNTVYITVVSLALVLFTDALAAYGFAKFKYRRKTFLFWLRSEE